MTKEEAFDNIDKLDYPEYAKFKHIETRIRLLMSCFRTLMNHLPELNTDIKKRMTEQKYPPESTAGLVLEYVIINIHEFYKQALRSGKKEKAEANLPDYYNGFLTKFRDKVLAHMEHNSPETINQYYRELDSLGGIKKLLDDLDAFIGAVF